MSDMLESCVENEGILPDDEKYPYSFLEKIAYHLPSINDVTCASILTLSSWGVLWNLLLLAAPGQPKHLDYIVVDGVLGALSAYAYKPLNTAAQKINVDVVQKKIYKYWKGGWANGPGRI